VSPAAMQLRTTALRALGFAALWWVLAEGRVESWLLAAAGVVVATAASLRLAPATPPLSVVGLARFTGFFVVESVRGGWDVARRALHRRLPLQPGLLEYDLTLDAGAARLLLVCALSLMPGTLSVRLRDRRLTVHTLTTDSLPPEKFHALQARVAQVFARPAAAASR
jgi:multicomponent Na+:H+ antiporter subunit E